MWTKTVTVPAPYDFAHALERLSLDPLLAVDRERQRITVPLALDGCFVPVTVEGVGTKDDRDLSFQLLFPSGKTR